MRLLAYLTIIFLSISCSNKMRVSFNIDLGLEVSGLTKISNQDSGEFVFLSKLRDSEKLSYECSLNQATFQPCTSPYAFKNLSDGIQTFKLNARMMDNITTDSFSTTWLVDLTAPTPNFISTPKNPSNSTFANFNFGGNDENGTGIESYECSLDSESFKLCSSLIPFVGLTTGLHNLKMRAVDKVGNISAPIGFDWLVDLIAPSVTINSGPDLVTTSGAAIFNFSANDTGGSNLGDIECRLDNEIYTSCTTPVTLVSLAQGQHTFYVKGNDGAGNSTIASYEWTVDLTDPQLSSFKISNGASVVAIRLTTTQLSTLVGGSAVAEMRFSENSDFLNSTWESYLRSGSFTLSNVSGIRTVYAQVRSSSGRMSNVLQTDIVLEVGSPPVVSVTSPAIGETHLPGTSLTISWICSPGSVSSPLALKPITSLKYTIDDGNSWHLIASDLPNNLSSTEGNFSWDIPTESPDGIAINNSTSFKISVGCSSLSGVLVNGMSAIQNSIWNVFAGESINANDNVHIDAADLSGIGSQVQSLASDSRGNIFYSKGNAILKIDPQSGLVSIWAGDIYKDSCDTMNLKFTSPQVVGVNIKDEIFIYSPDCSSFTKMNTLTKTIVWTKQLPTIDVSSSIAHTQITVRTYLNTGYFIYYSGKSFYMLDVNDINSVPVRIWGTPGNCGVVSPEGTEATLSPIPCNTTDLYNLAVRPDLTKMWVRVNNITYELTRTPSGSYTITNRNKSEWGARKFSTCLSPLGDSKFLYCRGVEGSGSIMGILDLETELWKPAQTITGQYKNMSTTLYLGSSNQDYILLFTLQSNEIFKYSFNGSISSIVKIGGSPFLAYGNGVGVKPSNAMFTMISSITYDQLNHNLYVLGVRHLRKFAVDPITSNVTSISTGFNNTASNSRAYGSMSVSNNGLAAFSYIGGIPGALWKSYNLATFNPVTESITEGSMFYFTPVNANMYPLITDVFNRNGSLNNLQSKGKYSTFLSDNNLYFSAASNVSETQNHWIFKSDLSILKINAIAGAIGAVGYDATDSGGPAIGAKLQRIYGMQPDSFNDLLIFDGDRLRKITTTTEPLAIKIYDQIDFSSFPNYPTGIQWTHAVHDNATGWNYFAVSNDVNIGRVAQIWSAHNITDGFIQIPTQGLQLSSEISDSKTLELAVTPLGLLLLDADKKRILMTPLKP